VVTPGRPDSDIDVVRGVATQEGTERTTRCFGGGFNETTNKALAQETSQRLRTNESDAWRHLKVAVGTLKGRLDER
jgi:hypothetical protein